MVCTSISNSTNSKEMKNCQQLKGKFTSSHKIFFAIIILLKILIYLLNS